MSWYICGCHDVFVDVVIYLWMSWYICGCYDIFVDVVIYLWMSWYICGCHDIFVDVMIYLLMSWYICGCHDIFVDVMVYLWMSWYICGCHDIFFKTQFVCQVVIFVYLNINNSFFCFVLWDQHKEISRSPSSECAAARRTTRYSPQWVL
jgi:hypothetical protein